MTTDSNKHRVHICCVVVSVTLILVCVFFLCWFMVTKPATAGDVAEGIKLKREISQLPPYNKLKRELVGDIRRVEKLFTDLYVRCVKGVEHLSQNLTWWDKTLTGLSRKIEDGL